MAFTVNTITLTVARFRDHMKRDGLSRTRWPSHSLTLYLLTHTGAHTRAHTHTHTHTCLRIINSTAVGAIRKDPLGRKAGRPPLCTNTHVTPHPEWKVYSHIHHESRAYSVVVHGSNTHAVTHKTIRFIFLLSFYYYVYIILLFLYFLLISLFIYR